MIHEVLNQKFTCKIDNGDTKPDLVEFFDKFKSANYVGNLYL